MARVPKKGDEPGPEAEHIVAVNKKSLCCKTQASKKGDDILPHKMQYHLRRRA